MTRINCVSVGILTDQHLLAEYREITRVAKLAKPLKDYGSYKMGTGHVKFFYNKGLFLKNRTEDLYQECVKRGFKVTHKVYQPFPLPELNQDWIPSSKDELINLGRLNEKLVDSKIEYRFWSNAVDTSHYIRS